ncbi:KTSC domain-containing protein [Reyranella massiliensis]|uniref:KTSC domain-containing protein n=1 Tax=Reyranella massiliensis TaxID=445220 RepID=UPI000A03BCF6
MIEVRSSTIAAVGWNSDTSTLRVAFKSRASYDYAKVPKGVYEAFLNAASKGRYFAQNIRDKYPTSRVR